MSVRPTCECTLVAAHSTQPEADLVFSSFSTVWSWVCRWFDQGTVDKIFILSCVLPCVLSKLASHLSLALPPCTTRYSSHEVLPTLLRYVDESNIPKRYGGSLDWDFGDPVTLDEESKKALGVDVLPRGPVRFGQQEGFRLTGTGRSAEEVREDEERREREVKSPAVNETTPMPTPAPTANGGPAVPVAAVEAEAIANGKEEAEVVTSDSEEEGDDIWAAAREEPAAPIRELAHTLEGTTL